MTSRLGVCSAVVLASLSAQAGAGDKVLVAPLPGWVTGDAPGNHPSGNAGPLLRFDEQVQVDGAKVTTFIDTTVPIQSPEILNSRGTVSIPWQPGHGDITFYRIDIIRAGRVIDALKGGTGFSVLRRETGLENLSVDGTLTAVKHLEDLQVGDQLRIAFSISSQDDLLQGYAQAGLLLLPSPVRLGFGRARLVWRTSSPLAWKALFPGLAAAPRPLDRTWSELVIPLPVAKLPEVPKNAPTRFTPLPALQFSTFPDWRSVATTMAPLYSVAGTITSGSDLERRIEEIGHRSADPMVRMADALRMVQDEVRYQLIALGAGNYQPQRPEDTWAKRYGDCKAKTLLLLAVLDRLGIAAEPVLANSKRGDAVAGMVPSAMAFDHVFARARVNGEDFWLDGTMLGSRIEDIRDVPRYGTVLPVLWSNKGLIDLPRRANGRSEVDVDVTYDMSAGPHLAAPFTMTVRYSGFAAARDRVQPNANYEDELVKSVTAAAKTWTGSEIIARPVGTYDPEHSVWTISAEGVTSLDWAFSDGHYNLPLQPPLNVTYDAPRDRASWHSIPALIDQPWTAHVRTTFVLPDSGRAVSVSGEMNRHLALPVVDWQRVATASGGRLVDEVTSRESGMEVPAESVSATDKAISDSMGGRVHIDLAPGYPQKWADIPARASLPAVKKMRQIYDQRIAEKPDDAARVAGRAAFRESLFDRAGAEEDYGKALALDPNVDRYLARSRLRASRSDHPGALADAQAAYDLEEGNADARQALANELAEAGKVGEALALVPADADPATDDGLSKLLARVGILETGNRHADAVQLINSLLEKRGRSAEVRNASCWFHALRNDSLASALDDCNLAIQLSSNPTAFLDSRGLVNFRAGRLTEAAADYAAALAGSPELPSSLYMSGIVALKSGKKEQGHAAIAAARQIYPDIGHFYERFGIRP